MTDIERLKQKLLDTKAEIEADLKRLKESLDFGSEIDHFEEEGDETEELSHYFGLKKPLEERLKAVDKALLKIKKGIYGTCEKCGKEIEKEVLEAAPESGLCKKCKGEN